MGRLTTSKVGLSVAPSRLLPTINNEADRSKHRESVVPWRKWYHSKRWQLLRQAILLRDLFTCQHPGCNQIIADRSQMVVHHKQPHRGNPTLFWSEANLVCVCKSCHDGPIQAAERRER